MVFQLALLITGLFFETRISSLAAENEIALTNKTGNVWHKRADQQSSDNAMPPLALHTGDTLRTETNSTAVVLVRHKNHVVRLWELSTLRVLPPEGESKSWLNLLEGALYFFSREKPNEVHIRSKHGTAAHWGTEFVMLVDSNRTILAVFDGAASLTNEWGATNLQSGDVGLAESGQPPIKLSLAATNLVQWWLYYPGVLDADELKFDEAEREDYSASLNAYKSGDLAAALRLSPGYPEPDEPKSDAGLVYLAALRLSAGHVDKAEMLLGRLQKQSSLASALRWVIAAVQGNVSRRPEVHTSASEWLGLSYYYQARHELKEALDAARQSVTRSTNFAFGWERVAELEFGFGRIAEAKRALQRSLALAPRNAQAHALNGFLLSADGRFNAAIESFETAIQLDSSLGNAWLGRGLVRIRRGDAEGGRADLQMAAVLEPNRSLLRSYLGKAFSDAGEYAKAALEFERAAALDANDPTPWLYSALQKREQNRINESIEDLEKSISLNTNRAVYRSHFLLDEDRAVRSSSLANVYQAAGMNEVALGEAARAVNYDYGNYSAHLFVAESFDALRDPTRFNLRNETVWFGELLLANLLSPVGGTPLSQHISQQEYSRLFSRDRVGLSSSTEYRSDGQVRELASQVGTIDNTSWALDLDFQHNDGIRPNNDLDRIEWYTTIKHQLTPQDSVMLLTKFQDYHSGDNFQYYEPTNARPNFRFDEYQSPIAMLGYHHEWGPGVHTLVLGGRLQSEQKFSDKEVDSTVLSTNADGTLDQYLLLEDAFDINYRSEFEIYTLELSQIVQSERATLLLGGRFQQGEFTTANGFELASGGLGQVISNMPAMTDIESDFQRLTGYGYYTVELIPDLSVTGGASYDALTAPRNHRHPPVSSGELRVSRWNPKAAVIWSPASAMSVRGDYTRSVGGASFDESFRLEPTQLAGFPQAFRSIISESSAGSVSAPVYETGGMAIDLKFKSQTYFQVRLEQLSSKVNEEIGMFQVIGGTSPEVKVPSSTSQSLNYEEWSAAATLNQLLGERWSVGAQYRFTDSRLRTELPALSVLVPGRTEKAALEQATVFTSFNHPDGFFFRAEAQWYRQHNSGYVQAMPGDDFVQFNLAGGYRFKRQRGDLTFSILNMGNEDYRLNPLNSYSELPRERVLAVRLRFRF